MRVNWWTLNANWTALKVGCALRGGVDVTSCIVQKPTLKAVDHSVQYSTFAVDAPAKAQLVVAIPALVGYLPIVRYSGNGWTTSTAPWPAGER